MNANHASLSRARMSNDWAAKQAARATARAVVATPLLNIGQRHLALCDVFNLAFMLRLIGGDHSARMTFDAYHAVLSNAAAIPLIRLAMDSAMRAVKEKEGRCMANMAWIRKGMDKLDRVSVERAERIRQGNPAREFDYLHGVWVTEELMLRQGLMLPHIHPVEVQLLAH